MRIFNLWLTLAMAAFACGTLVERAEAQPPIFSAAPPLEVDPANPPSTSAPLSAAPVNITPISAADAATIDGCQVIARIDGQIVQACEVLWHVNLLIERNRDKIPPEQESELRRQLLRREVAGALDRKLLYGEFRRTIPAENLPRIEENLREPFETMEMPELMKELEVSTPLELEHKLTQLGSSLADLRQAFNEKAIASEWLRSKVKVSEEVSPDEMLEYYQSHLTSYDEPAKVRWEELMVRKSRFNTPAEAYAEIAHMGNEVWTRAGTRPDQRGPAFAEVARQRSDGFRAKDSGGQHDWTNQGALTIHSIDEALFTLQVGQMSPILETEDAFYIVRPLERKPAGRRPFTEVQADIRKSLMEERVQKARETYIEKLRKDARIWTVFAGNITADQLLGRQPEENVRR